MRPRCGIADHERLTAQPYNVGVRDWPARPSADKLAIPENRENHVLDVYLVEGRPVDLRLDGESLYPVWFKLEFKEDGQVSAKVKGLRLATRFGDAINVHQGRP
jgi:hypothetical protein